MQIQAKILNAPDIPVSEVDGLIKLKDLTQDIEVQLEPWSYSEPGDTYQLMLDSVPVGPVKTLSLQPLNPGETLKLSINAETMLIKSGSYRVSYKVQSTIGGMTSDSMTTTIQVDRCRPGAGLLAPIIFPSTSKCGELIGMIPGYAGIAAGDIVQTRCNNVAGPSHSVTADEVDQIPKIVFPWEFLESLKASILKIDYIITDRAGNISKDSQPSWITLRV